MKKLVSLGVAIALALILIPAVLAEGDGPVGERNCVAYAYAGVEYEASFIFPKGCSVELRADGMGRVAMEDYVEENVKWADTGEAILLSGSYISPRRRWPKAS